MNVTNTLNDKTKLERKIVRTMAIIQFRFFCSLFFIRFQHPFAIWPHFDGTQFERNIFMTIHFFWRASILLCIFDHPHHITSNRINKYSVRISCLLQFDVNLKMYEEFPKVAHIVYVCTNDDGNGSTGKRL